MTNNNTDSHHDDTRRRMEEEGTGGKDPSNITILPIITKTTWEQELENFIKEKEEEGHQYNEYTRWTST